MLSLFSLLNVAVCDIEEAVPNDELLLESQIILLRSMPRGVFELATNFSLGNKRSGDFSG